MKNKTIIASMLMLPLLASVALACSCIYYENVEDKLKNAQIVFSGKVTELEQLESYPVQYRAHFEIDNYWKRVGIATDENNLIISSVQDTGANCGYNFVEGKEYLIYAYMNNETGRIETNSCMGNSELSKAQDEIRELNELTNQEPAPKPEEQNIFVRFFSWLKNLFS